MKKLLCMAMVLPSFAFGDPGSIMAGVASIIGAATPAAVTAIQTDADVKINQIQSDASITTTEIEAKNQVDLAKEGLKGTQIQTQGAIAMTQIGEAGKTARESLITSAMIRASSDNLKVTKDQLMFEREKALRVIEVERAGLALQRKQKERELILSSMGSSTSLPVLSAGFSIDSSPRAPRVVSPFVAGAGVFPASFAPSHRLTR